MKILVLIEQRDGKIKNSAYEALSLAHKLTGNPSDVAGAVIGSGVNTSELAGWGAESILYAENSSFERYNIGNYSNALEAAIKSFEPDLILAAASPMGKDILPRLAARCDAGIITDVVDINVSGNNTSATKPMYAGKCLAEVHLQGEGLKFVSIRPNVFGSDKPDAGSATVSRIEVPDSTLDMKTTEVRKGTSEKADLTEAVRIVAGGRSVGSADNFKILDECANVMNATVGASRAAVDSGYAPHSMQVGQTGKTVNPNLYLACGISGSIQHMAGMRTSKVIVAINTDPEAPIFSVADYGIVADLFEAVPLLTKKLQSML